MDYDTTQDDRMMSMLAYLLGLFTSFIGPLVIYFVKKDQSRFAGFHALQAVALQGALAVLGVGAFVASFVLALLGPLVLLAVPLYFLLSLVGLAVLVFSIVAAVKSYGGEWYRVPVVGDYVARQIGL
jgi:uncharacterized protein